MEGAPIESVNAVEILDNRLEPTLRVTVHTPAGDGQADVPRGRSRGRFEVVDRRDRSARYGGRGVLEAVQTISDRVAPAVSGLSVTDQRSVDDRLRQLDGTQRKRNLGGNVTTGVSIAVADAAATAVGLPLYRYLGGIEAVRLPIPFLDVIEGGELAGSGLPFQEHQIVPTGATSFSDAIRMGAEVYYELGDLLEHRFGPAACTVGDEGGYTPQSLHDEWDAFDVILEAIEGAGYAGRFGIAADVAASHFFDPQTERYELREASLTRSELIERYVELDATFPLVSLEDPLEQTDFRGVADLTGRIDAQIIGDDLFVTDVDRLSRGIEAGAGTALLVKVNQVGTLSETLEATAVAREAGYAIQVSERSGQTADTWLADLAVGLQAGQIKTGVTRSERTEQYNRLLEIERALGSQAEFGDPRLPDP